MAKQNAKSATNDIQSLFDPQGYQDVLKTWASMNERMTSLVVEAGLQVTDVTSATTKEALSNVRELTQVRDETADYGKAYTDFVQKQTELFTRTVQAYASEAQKVNAMSTDMATKAGEEIADKATTVADTTAQAARKAA